MKFPTDAEATSYPVLDTTLRQARPADFVESTEVDGRTIMHYRQVIEKANVAESFADPSNTTTLTREDGVVLNRTYSDARMMIERDGVLYSEAIDPDNLNRVYMETNVPIVAMTEAEEKAAAYDILMGVAK